MTTTFIHSEPYAPRLFFTLKAKASQLNSEPSTFWRKWSVGLINIASYGIAYPLGCCEWVAAVTHKYSLTLFTWMLNLEEKAFIAESYLTHNSLFLDYLNTNIRTNILHCAAYRSSYTMTRLTLMIRAVTKTYLKQENTIPNEHFGSIITDLRTYLRDARTELLLPYITRDLRHAYGNLSITGMTFIGEFSIFFRNVAQILGVPAERTIPLLLGYINSISRHSSNQFEIIAPNRGVCQYRSKLSELAVNTIINLIKSETTPTELKNWILEIDPLGRPRIARITQIAELEVTESITCPLPERESKLILARNSWTALDSNQRQKLINCAMSSVDKTLSKDAACLYHQISELAQQLLSDTFMKRTTVHYVNSEPELCYSNLFDSAWQKALQLTESQQSS